MSVSGAKRTYQDVCYLSDNRDLRSTS